MRKLNNELRDELLDKIENLRAFIYNNHLDLDFDVVRELDVKLEAAHYELKEEAEELKK